MSMNIEEILEQIDDMLDAAWAMPLSGGKIVLDGERMRDMVDSVRASLPMEIRQARAIVKDRTEIVNTAKKEAEEYESAEYLKTQLSVVKNTVNTRETVNVETCNAVIVDNKMKK